MVDQLVFTEVSVAGTPPVSFCVDPPVGDAAARWLLEHDWIDEPVHRMFVDLVEPGMRVLDLGSRLGTFSLPAAALGAHVLAIDASPHHVELLKAAALHNRFDQLDVALGVIAAPAHPPAVEVAGNEVPATTVDELLEERGWDGVELVKMDIEGAEPEALAGMERVFSRGRPPILLQSNGSRLPLFGSSVSELRQLLADLGYELLLIDHLAPGTLMEARPDALQPECVSHLLATVKRPKVLRRKWRFEPRLGREATLARLLDGATSDDREYRAYAASLLADGPHWLRGAPEVGPAALALEHDLDEYVRRAVRPDHEPSWAVEAMLSPEPPTRGRPQDIRLLAEGVSVRRPSSGLEPPLAPPQPPPDELLLTDAWLHVRSGQLVGLLADEPASGPLLLRVLAGHDEPAAGRLELAGHTVLLSPLCAGLELELTVTENIKLLGEFLGIASGTVGRGIDRVAALAGLNGELTVPLADLRAVDAAKLALAAALELASPELLILDAVPAALDEDFSAWLGERVAALRAAGGAVVQLIGGAEVLVGPPDRVMWIAAGRVQASGHADSLLEAHRRHGLGLSDLPLDRRPALAMRVPR